VSERPTLGQVLRPVLAKAPPSLRLSPHQWKTLRMLARCRTAALGGQAFYCPHCEREHVVAHSCRNRHCPHCQGTQAMAWLEQQAQRLLPIPYYHLVFTLPHTLNGLIRQNRRVLFKLLFDAASQTLLCFGVKRLGAQLGITAVLHTWSQTLLDHYHLHCIVTGGGVACDQSRWIRTSAHYLFPVRALSRMFRGKFRDGLQELHRQGKLEFHGQLAGLAPPRQFAALVRQAARPEWVVYAKRPFAGPRQVLAYLSRYTHRVALSAGRLLAADGQSVRFEYKDYADGARHKTMRLRLTEFVRRFCLHVLPERFVKIRHYGLLGNRQREERLAQARRLLEVRAAPVSAPPCEANARPAEPPGVCCPYCHQPGLVWVREVPSRSVVPLDSS